MKLPQPNRIPAPARHAVSKMPGADDISPFLSPKCYDMALRAVEKLEPRSAVSLPDSGYEDMMIAAYRSAVDAWVNSPYQFRSTRG